MFKSDLIILLNLFIFCNLAIIPLNLPIHQLDSTNNPSQQHTYLNISFYQPHQQSQQNTYPPQSDIFIPINFTQQNQHKVKVPQPDIFVPINFAANYAQDSNGTRKGYAYVPLLFAEQSQQPDGKVKVPEPDRFVPINFAAQQNEGGDSGQSKEKVKTSDLDRFIYVNFGAKQDNSANNKDIKEKVRSDWQLILNQIDTNGTKQKVNFPESNTFILINFAAKQNNSGIDKGYKSNWELILNQIDANGTKQKVKVPEPDRFVPINFAAEQNKEYRSNWQLILKQIYVNDSQRNQLQSRLKNLTESIKDEINEVEELQILNFYPDHRFQPNKSSDKPRIYFRQVNDSEHRSEWQMILKEATENITDKNYNSDWETDLYEEKEQQENRLKVVYNKQEKAVMSDGFRQVGREIQERILEDVDLDIVQQNIQRVNEWRHQNIYNQIDRIPILNMTYSRLMDSVKKDVMFRQWSLNQIQNQNQYDILGRFNSSQVFKNNKVPENMKAKIIDKHYLSVAWMESQNKAKKNKTKLNTQVYRILKDDQLKPVYEKNLEVTEMKDKDNYGVYEFSSNLVVQAGSNAYMLDFVNDLTGSYKNKQNSRMFFKELFIESISEKETVNSIDDDALWQQATKIKNPTIKKFDLSGIDCDCPKLSKPKVNELNKNQVSFYAYCVVDDSLIFQKINMEMQNDKQEDIFMMNMKVALYFGLIGLVSVLAWKWSKNRLSLYEIDAVK